jgi:uncharacterized protein YbbC (DUF1343 family)
MKPTVQTGLDLLADSADRAGAVLRMLRGRSVGLLVNQASVDAGLSHAIERLVGHPEFRVGVLFGPQHGIWGTTQDNMIEWEGFHDARLDLPVHSLYGEHRKPPAEWLRGVEAVICDLVDVGARYYTFVWTATLVMERCAELGIPFVVLDRPNPINGVDLEGPPIERGFSSFVGRFSIPMRHGMTMGELLTMFNQTENIGCDLHVVRMEGWRREMWFEETGLPWAMPSPNMPTVETAVVYPGQCLVEGTRISEGRGTTRPFELLGAPFVDPWALREEMARAGLEGVVFRPLYFEPTFQKHARETCGGLSIHVLDRAAFRSVKMTVALFCALRRLYGAAFEWKQPPYEYETVKLPIDILTGSEETRRKIDGGAPVDEIVEPWEESLRAFAARRQEFLLYP